MIKPEPKTAQNELRAIEKLCNGKHAHIIHIFRSGEFSDASYVFIDMELCAVNLDQYNKGIRTALVIHDSILPLRAKEIWTIIAQIASALEWIHKHNEIHRDLKPQNGSILPFCDLQ